MMLHVKIPKIHDQPDIDVVGGKSLYDTLVG